MLDIIEPLPYVKLFEEYCKNMIQSLISVLSMRRRSDLHA